MAPPTNDDDIITALCGLVMNLISEREVLENIVTIMMMGLDESCMPPEEQAMCLAVRKKWGWT